MMADPLMAKTQTTREGHDIPIPKRSDFLDNLKKAVAPEKKSESRRAPKKR